MRHTVTDLRQMQSLDLESKIRMSQNRIRQWYEHWDGQVYVAFSGGKDSTVLLNLVREIYPAVPACFCDTGLEFPEIRDFVKTFENVVWLKPKMNFRQVIEKYGFPVVSKEQSQFIDEARNTKSDKVRDIRLKYGNKAGRGMVSQKWRFLLDAPFAISDRCCDVMKKRPSKKYEKDTGRAPIVGTMAIESQLRRQQYIKFGCNAFECKRPISKPLSFWTDCDVWEYIKSNNVPYSKIYDMGYERTGCTFCMLGVHLEKEPNRFQRMQKTHPKQWKFCMDKLGLRKVLKYIGVPCEWREPDPALFTIEDTQ